MNDIINYRFLVPLNEDTADFFTKTFIESWYTSDGSPFCGIYEGLLIKRNDILNLPKKLDYDIYEISDRFLDTDDFVSDFLDGDCEDNDFIYEKRNK